MRKSKLLLFLIIAILLTGCAGPNLGVNPAKDPKIKALKAYYEIDASRWKDTKIQVAKGDAIVIASLYPKGFLYPVKGNIKGSEESFDSLDVDSGEIYRVKADGTLRIGLEQNIQSPIRTGVFIFKDGTLHSIISDLTYIESKGDAGKTFDLTLAILCKKKAEILALDNRTGEALAALDEAIKYFQRVDAKMYAASISRLYKLKAGIYKSLQNQAKFQENINHSFQALMEASEYYGLLSQGRYAFLQSLTAEERFLLTATKFFQNSPGEDSLAKALWSLATYYQDQGNMSQSLAYFERAIREAKKTGNKEQIHYAYHWLGMRHAFFGFYDLAYQSFATAQEYCTSQNMEYFAKFQMADSLRGMGKITKVSEFRKFVALPFNYKDVRGLGFKIDAACARIHRQNREYKQAIQIYEDLLGNRSKEMATLGRPVPVVEFEILLNLGECYLAAGELKECSNIIKKMESKIENIKGSAAFNVRLDYLRSNLAARRGEDPSPPLLEAIKYLEEIRPTAFTEKDYEYWERALANYDRAIDLLYQKEDFGEALSIAEKARSRRFLDSLGNKQLGVKNKSANVAYQQADAILQTMGDMENDMLNAAEAAGIKVRAVYQEGTRYSQQLESYRDKLNAIARSDPQFGNAHNIIPPSPAEVRKKLPPDVTVLEYYLTNSALFTWVLDRNNIHMVRQDIAEKELREWVLSFRSFAGSGSPKRDLAVTGTVSKEVGDAGGKLYQLLVAPVQKYITTGNVCIVPYGVLNYLPFQALYDGEKYFVERHAISYLPSLSVLEFLGKGERKDNYHILAFGNPDLKDRALDLPATEKEVEEIKTIFPNTEIYKQEKATKGLAKKLASRFDIIHFACHGQYVPEAPLTSCILLSPEEGDNGRLEANEIFDMDMKADLVVTSACQTSIGQIGKGDEVVGLTRAFLYAGANSVLGSLWSISDEATAVFMKEFYSNLKKFDKAEALRQAQVKMIQSKEYSNPFYWAAFNLTGSF